MPARPLASLRASVWARNARPSESTASPYSSVPRESTVATGSSVAVSKTNRSRSGTSGRFTMSTTCPSDSTLLWTIECCQASNVTRSPSISSPAPPDNCVRLPDSNGATYSRPFRTASARGSWAGISRCPVTARFATSTTATRLVEERATYALASLAKATPTGSSNRVARVSGSRSCTVETTCRNVGLPGRASITLTLSETWFETHTSPPVRPHGQSHRVHADRHAGDDFAGLRVQHVHRVRRGVTDEHPPADDRDRVRVRAGERRAPDRRRGGNSFRQRGRGRGGPLVIGGRQARTPARRRDSRREPRAATKRTRSASGGSFS